MGTTAGVGRLLLDGIALIRVRFRTADRTLPDQIQTRTDRLAKRLGVNRPVQVHLSSKVIVPMTLGGRRPVILLPPELTRHPDALELTLRHEFVHLRWYDDLAHLVERLIATTFFAHPLVHRIATLISNVRECACDAAVLADENTSTSDYARLLAAFSDASSSKRLEALPLSEAPSSLKSRLQTMRSSLPRWLSNPVSLGAALVTLGLAVTVGVAGCSDPVAPSSQKAPTETATPSTHTKRSDDVYADVDQEPDCGGLGAVRHAVQYPDFARDAGIEGRVVVQFTVNDKGKVVNPEIARGAHTLLNEAALAGMKTLECTPGMRQGEPVQTPMTVPITFKLPTDSSSSADSTTAHTSDTPSVHLNRVGLHDVDPTQSDRLHSGPLFSAETRRILESRIYQPPLL